ncbi:MAG TPA: hypothetical protein VE890_01850, partial [Thermoguttaceae bacterium]|nr:hypothetical protein [Thermoguttaceae bacterium]
SPSSNLDHYHPGAPLNQFDIPHNQYYDWIDSGQIEFRTDYHMPSGVTTPEIRIYPPASERMNDYLVPPEG